MFCMVPGVYMEGCPRSQAVNLSMLCLMGLLPVFLFFGGHVAITAWLHYTNKAKKIGGTFDDEEIVQTLKQELFGGSPQNTIGQKFAQLKECSTPSVASKVSLIPSFCENKQHPMQSQVVAEMHC